MGIPVGINGFGRIGRVVLRIILERGDGFDLRGINLRKADLDYMESVSYTHLDVYKRQARRGDFTYHSYSPKGHMTPSPLFAPWAFDPEPTGFLRPDGPDVSRETLGTHFLWERTEKKRKSS